MNKILFKQTQDSLSPFAVIYICYCQHMPIPSALGLVVRNTTSDIPIVCLQKKISGVNIQ